MDGPAGALTNALATAGCCCGFTSDMAPLPGGERTGVGGACCRSTCPCTCSSGGKAVGCGTITLWYTCCGCCMHRVGDSCGGVMMEPGGECLDEGIGTMFAAAA